MRTSDIQVRYRTEVLLGSLRHAAATVPPAPATPISTVVKLHDLIPVFHRVERYKRTCNLCIFDVGHGSPNLTCLQSLRFDQLPFVICCCLNLLLLYLLETDLVFNLLGQLGQRAQQGVALFAVLHSYVLGR